ncbi:protein PTHB1 isoform X2 [Pectinophora gossypiella]|uniref:protein PTHB1 isoform X2 n=1 Tax=Pectinophora gossypiella TaxID=13191 RepID=UPI00214ECB71|nr:protein PTHB1 isoform X2 [Pectinophora gossypiella]
MSLFKVKQWWSNERLQSEETNEGFQNSSCLKVDKFNSHTDSDCVVVGDGMILKIYKPSKDVDVSHTLLEAQLSATILQIETGKFVAGSEDRQILVLHPQSYGVYQLNRKEGHTDAGEQNLLKLLTKHTFTRRAHSLTCGPFGNIKTRDFICIQALDGSLSFFDQESFLFMYISHDVIIPGPVCYIASSDSFVLCKSTWVIEIHSYQQLREFSELNVRQNKKHIPQWVYNAGEEISSVQVIQTSSNISSILALGERHLCCFQDNGLMKFMIKFDYMPICFFAYLIEPTARLLVMISSEDSKLYIYEGTTLLWSCDLLYTAVSISRCFLKYLPGGIVTLSTKGVVTVSYLGTEPDLNSNAGPMINEVIDPEQIQSELGEVEEKLTKILDGEEGIDRYTNVDQILKIKADVGKPVQNLHDEFTRDSNITLHLLKCPVVVMLSCQDPNSLKSVQITFGCYPPFECSDSSICLENINGTEIIETQVFIASPTDISDTKVRIIFTIIDATGKINVTDREVLLPLSLYCLPTEAVIEDDFILRIHTNTPCADLVEVFTDFTKEDLTKYGISDNNITFTYRSTKKTVTLKATDNQYIIEAKDYSDMTAVLQHFTMKLASHFERSGVKDFRISIRIDKDTAKMLTHNFMKNIESHAKERVKSKKFEDELTVLQRQFTLVQKKLLVQYGSLPPGDCDPLEFLMKDTHRRIVKTVHDIIECRESVCRVGNSVTAVGRLLIFIFQQTVEDDFKVKLIEEMLTLGSLYYDYQDWEEAVTQALTYILNNVFQKSEKDKEKLATVSEQGILSQVNLKRFLKQIRMILEKIFSEIHNDAEDVSKPENKFTRIEEFVEVI